MPKMKKMHLRVIKNFSLVLKSTNFVQTKMSFEFRKSRFKAESTWCLKTRTALSLRNCSKVGVVGGVDSGDTLSGIYLL